MKLARYVFTIALMMFLSFGVLFPLADAVVLGSNANVEIETAYAISTERDEADANTAQSKRAEFGYIGYDAGRLFEKDKTVGDNRLMTGFVNMIKFAVTVIFLPLAIIFCMWRTIYIAIFPMIAHTDPLDMLRNDRYTNKTTYSGNVFGPDFKTNDYAVGGLGQKVLNSMSNPMSSGANASHTAIKSDYFTGAYYNSPDTKNMTELATSCLKIELKFAVFGLTITFIAWGIIRLLLQVVIVGLDKAEKIAEAIQ